MARRTKRPFKAAMRVRKARGDRHLVLRVLEVLFLPHPRATDPARYVRGELVNPSKTYRANSERECQRRAKQIAQGRLQVSP